MGNDIYTRDGISISVSKSEDGFCGTWTCPRCKVSGSTTSKCDNADEASGRAKARAFSEPLPETWRR